MTWEIFLGISALVSFLIGIGAIVFKASKVLTSLDVTVKGLSDALKDFKKDSKADRKEIHDKIDDHEIRIGKLEIKVDGNEN